MILLLEVKVIIKILVRNIKSNEEEEIIISDEKIGSPGISLMQKTLTPQR